MAKLGDYIRKGTKYQSKAAKKGHMQSLDKYEKDSVAENSRAGEEQSQGGKKTGCYRTRTETKEWYGESSSKGPQKRLKLFMRKWIGCGGLVFPALKKKIKNILNISTRWLDRAISMLKPVSDGS